MAAALALACAAGCTDEPVPTGTDPAPKLDEVFPPLPPLAEPVVSPFGDRYDPTMPPPVVHETKGPGITEAKLVASGPVDVKKVPRPPGKGAVLYGVVADVTVAPGSTTDVLGPASITLAGATGQVVPLFAACMPTLQNSSLITPGEGTSILALELHLDGREWVCGGGNARMARRVGTGGFKLTGPEGSGWSGPMVLLFEAQNAHPRSLTIAGRTIALPAKRSE